MIQLVMCARSEQLNHFCLETGLQKWSTLFQSCKFTDLIVEKFLPKRKIRNARSDEMSDRELIVAVFHERAEMVT